MMLALKSGPQIAAKVGNPAGLLCRRIWYSVVKSGVLGITEYRQGRPLYSDRYGTHSHLNKLAPRMARKAGLIGNNLRNWTLAA